MNIIQSQLLLAEDAAECARQALVDAHKSMGACQSLATIPLIESANRLCDSIKQLRQAVDADNKQEVVAP
mgnify:CR=1 FL=1